MTTARKTTSAKATETLEAAAAAQQKQFETAVKAGADAFSQGYETIYATAKQQMDKLNELTFKSYDDLAEFNKETIEAVVESGNLMAKGVEDMGQEIAAYAQMTTEKNIEAAKKMFTAKNIQDAMDLQTAWAKTVMDSFFAESAKLQDMSLQLSTAAAKPLNKQVNAAVEKFAKPITA